MKIQRLTQDLTISTQLEPEKIEKLMSHGYKSIICNRPDGESRGQPSFASLAQMAKDKGISARYIPVKITGPTETEYTAFAKAYAELPKPILAYCRSGTRCALLWDKIKVDFSHVPTGDARSNG